MKTIVAFSGGKDSTAALLWTRNNLTKNIVAVFCDTQWENPTTYTYIKEVTKKLDIELVELKSKRYDGFFEMGKRKKRFPSRKAQFCTQHLKTEPMIDWLLDQVRDDVLIIQGNRALESAERSRQSKQCTYFKYYRAPYGHAKNGKPKYHKYRRKDVIAFSEEYSNDVLRPVFDWTGQECIDYIKANDIEPNPLYGKGMRRVGCFPCINASHKEIRGLMEFFPERLDEVANMEKELGSSFFAKGKIPAWACKNGEYPLMEDIVKYLELKNATGDLFAEEGEPTSCLSYYGLCE